MNRSSTQLLEVASDVAMEFRAAMRLHAAGVCIISCGDGEAVNGMAATAVTSFSLDPPSILVCVNESASIASELSKGTLFGISILGRHHEPVAAAFSRKPSGRPRFDSGDWKFEERSPPWLRDAPANLLCVLEHSLTYGTHRALIGRVASVRIGPFASSLVYRDGAYL